MNDAFFAAALLQERAGALGATIAELEARLRETKARVNEGAALGADAAAIEAALLQRRQDEAELRVEPRRRAGATVGAHRAIDSGRRQPRSARSARSPLAGANDAEQRERAARVRAVRPLARPRRPAAGDGRHPDAVPRVGLRPRRLRAPGPQFHQRPVRVLRAGRRAAAVEALRLEHRGTRARGAGDSVANHRGRRSGVHEGLERSTDTDLRTVDRLAETIALDDRIVTLREQIDRSTETRFRENVVTASEYLDRNTELLDARFTQSAHRVELAQAGASC